MTRIDLLSADMVPAWRRHAGVAGTMLVVSLLAASFLAVHMSQAAREQAIVDDLHALGQREERLRSRRDAAFEECRATDLLVPALDRVRSAAAATQALVGTMQLVAAALPEDLWLDEVAFEGSQVRLVGATGSRHAVSTFVRRIAGDGGLGEITLKVDDTGSGASFVLDAAR